MTFYTISITTYSTSFVTTIRYACACLVTIILLNTSVSLQSMDNAHFWRARLWNNEEPRFAKDFLRSFDVLVAQASTRCARNYNGDKVPLLYLFGVDNFTNLSLNTRLGKQSQNFFFSGHFETTEAQFNGYINLVNGFFIHLHVPVRHLRLNDAHPTIPSFSCHHRHTQDHDWYEWRETWINYEKRLNKWGIALPGMRRTGVGDTTLLAGWSWTGYDSCLVDYSDFTFQTGVLFPTGERANPHELISIPFGYNGHFAWSTVFDSAIGFLGWITLGAHTEALVFADTHQFTRLGHHPITEQYNQHNMPVSRLTKPFFTRIKEQQDPLLNVTVYLKLDHWIDRFSVLLGYSHDTQGKSSFPTLALDEPLLRDRNNPLIAGWSMNVLHTVIEYDCATEDNLYGPRISFMYNHLLDGENVFNASSIGGIIGLDFEWQF